MTRHLPILLAFAAAMASIPAGAQTAPAIEANFVDPARFTDFRLDRWRGGPQVERLAQELREFLGRESPRYLPAGSKLTVTFTDIDMAGEYEAWQRAGAGDVRIVRDLYPSRMSFAFTLADGAGKVVQEGSRRLVSAMVLGPTTRAGDGPLRHEKALLHEWLAREFTPGR
jgi:hypothetical protein